VFSLWRLKLFAALAATVFAAGATAVVWIALRRLTGRDLVRVPDRLKRPLAWAGRTAVALSLLGACLIAWSFAEPYFPEVTRVSVPVRNLAGRVRIVHITDAHCDPRERIEGRIPHLVRPLRPDLIAFTGDAVNCREGVGRFRSLMRELAQIAPTFAVRGNWDVWWFADADIFGGTGVRELDGQAVRLDIRGTELWIAGAAVENEAAIGVALTAVPPGRPLVFLHHYPDAWDLAAHFGADLHLAGDTHGGQVRMPLVGALARLTRGGPYRDVGLHEHLAREDAFLYVNRGIGMEGGMAPRVRFMCRPEVAFIELMPRP
jgi:predicted MPP superfamily phosphohydrolase